jgi:hypothetical protein
MNFHPRLPSRLSAGQSNSKFLSCAPQAAIHLLALICTRAATLIANPEEGGISGKVTVPQNVVVAGSLSKLVNAVGVAVSVQRSDAQGKIEFAPATHKDRREELL